MDWTVWDCPNCGAAYCNCSCKEWQEQNAWRYFDCVQCGVKAGTKCDCKPALSLWERFKDWIKK